MLTQKAALAPPRHGLGLWFEEDTNFLDLMASLTHKS